MPDPMDELIADLERVVPTPRTRAWGEMPSLVEIQFWTDRVLAECELYADSTGEIRVREPENGRYDYEDDPDFHDFMRRFTPSATQGESSRSPKTPRHPGPPARRDDVHDDD